MFISIRVFSRRNVKRKLYDISDLCIYLQSDRALTDDIFSITYDSSLHITTPYYPRNETR